MKTPRDAYALAALIVIALAWFLNTVPTYQRNSSAEYYSQLAQSSGSLSISPPANVSSQLQSSLVVSIQWEGSSSAAGYVVYHNAKDIATTSQQSYTYSRGVVPSASPYCFSVVSFSQQNEYSSRSADSCVNVSTGSLATITSFTANAISSNIVKLEWRYPLSEEQKNNIDPVNGYAFKFIVERSVDGGVWDIIGNTSLSIYEADGSDSASYTDAQPQSGRLNSYRVSAFMDLSKGFSPPSSVVSVTPGQSTVVPAAPSNLGTRSSNDPTELVLTWKDNSINETGFVVEKQEGQSWPQVSTYQYVNTSETVVHTIKNLQYGSTYTLRVRAVNEVGSSDPSNTVTFTTVPPPNPYPTGYNTLCIFNNNLNLSKEICDYYVSKRNGSHSKGLAIPDGAFRPGDEYNGSLMREEMTESSFSQYVLVPLAAYISQYNSEHSLPQERITHVAVAKGFPIRIFNQPVAPTVIYSANQRFNEYFSASDIAFSYLSGFTLADVQKLIDKAQAPAPNLSTSVWLFDLDNSTGATENQLGDADALTARTRLVSLGVNADQIVIDTKNDNPLVFTRPIVAYGGLGTHHNQDAQQYLGSTPPYGYPPEWPYRSIDAPVANRAIIEAYESFFASTFENRPQGQGFIAQATAPTTFKGASYSRSFSGAIGTVFEPGGGGLVPFQTVFVEYMKGHTLARAFKMSTSRASFPQAMVVGDPLMTIRDGGEIISTRMNVQPTISAGPDVSVSGSVVVLAGRILDKGYPERIESIVWEKISGPGSVTFSKRTLSFEGDTSVLTSTATFSVPGTYTISLSVSNGNITSQDTVSIQVAQGSDTVPPITQVILPTGTLSATTTNTELRVTTNEVATCMYSASQGVSYGATPGIPFSTSTTTTHVVMLQGLVPGTTYRYYVRCRDLSYNVQSADVPVIFSTASVAVQPSDTVPPSVSVSYPTVYSEVFEGPITVTAIASDIVGVVGVKFYIDGQQIGDEDNTAPFSRTTSLSAGNHRVYAVARDMAGNTATSPTVNFSVDESEPYIPLYTPPTQPPPSVPTTPFVDSLTTLQDPVVYTTLPTQDQNRYVEYVRSVYFTSPVTTITTAKKSTDSGPIRLVKNYELGDQSSEVKLLQRTLNLLGFTVAESGPGSRGNETTFFDEKTKDALIRYQKLYIDTGVIASGTLDNTTIVLLNKDIDRLVDIAEHIESNMNTVNLEEGGIVSRLTLFIDQSLQHFADFVIGLFRR